MAKRKWSEQSRAERWGLIGAVLAACLSVPFILHLGPVGVFVAVGVAALVGAGLGRLAAGLFAPR